MTRALRCAGITFAALATLTACGGRPEPCPALDLIPRVGVSWRAESLPYDAATTYRLCAAQVCTTGALQAYGDQAHVSLDLPESFDDRTPQVTLRLSHDSGTPVLNAARTVTLQQAEDGCEQALTGTLQLTADGELKDVR
ncbi:hypothetical protein AB0L83_30320 [Streptomyces sp. NPDC052071]|uniref:hypothetical protein n=1 Tax=Streptomyces TaxID=1883 RepID=UPI0023F6E385|nr:MULTISPECIES: hypothetical protein [Streptomyces]MDF6066677.1 hypothetical protein [Streptomyces sp. JH010]WJY35344.1 hypothetical protein QTO28_31755 [Streptomyces sp. P9-2B-1]WSK26436.1 hypothetical protein OG483_00610 [[Kitasatospora] papulosa]